LKHFWLKQQFKSISIISSLNFFFLFVERKKHAKERKKKEIVTKNLF
jgi:hypothetical protein